MPNVKSGTLVKPDELLEAVKLSKTVMFTLSDETIHYFQSTHETKAIL